MTSARNQEKLRVLIMDDEPLLLDGLRGLMHSQRDLLYCGEVSSWEALVRAIPSLHPDLVIVEPWLRDDQDGLELVRELLARHPGLRLLVLSRKAEEVHAEAMLRAGALGYVMKAQPTEDLMAAIRATARGEAYIGQRLVSVILSRVLHAPEDAMWGKLTEREREVFQLLGQGLDTHRVAAHLQLSAKTVAAHRENIKHKLALPDAASLRRAAEQWVRSNKRS